MLLKHYHVLKNKHGIYFSVVCLSLTTHRYCSDHACYKNTEDVHIDLDQLVVPKRFQDTYFYLLDVTNLNSDVVLCVLEADLFSLTMRAIK
jgi:hypothetical protein